jgi:hypothetical protein
MRVRGRDSLFGPNFDKVTGSGIFFVIAVIAKFHRKRDKQSAGFERGGGCYRISVDREADRSTGIFWFRCFEGIETMPGRSGRVIS